MNDEFKTLVHFYGDNEQIRLHDSNTTNFADVYTSATWLNISVDPTNTVASSDIVFFVDGNEVVRFTDTGYLGIGTTTPDNAIDIEGTTQSAATISIRRIVDGGNTAAYLELRRARGTKTTPTAVQSGDSIGKIWFRGRTETLWSLTDAIEVIAAENFTDTAHGTDLIFKSTPNGSTEATEVLKFEQNGQARIGASGELTNEGDLFLNLDGVLALKETTIPTADSGIAKLYPKNDNRLYHQDGAGVEHLIGGAGIGDLGEIYQNNNANVTTINTVNVWEHVTNFSSGELVNITFGSNALTIQSTGKYLLMGSISSQSALANKDFEFAISINDSINTKTISKRRYGNTDTGSQSISAILNLTASDVIKLEVRNLTDANNITIVDANISLHFI